jgi:hypothetical protein
MAATDIFAFPALDTVLNGAANLMNSVYLPAATPGAIEAGLTAIVAITAGLLALPWLARRFTAGQHSDTTLAERVDDLSQRLEATELLLADATNETDQLRQRLEQLTSRQEALSAGNSRGGLRQAIALSKHGATTRHLIDTCGLSQGEAHLIQTLYGRPPGSGQPEELH